MLLEKENKVVFTFSAEGNFDGDVCVCVLVINEDEFDAVHVRRLTARLPVCEERWKDGRVQMWGAGSACQN